MNDERQDSRKLEGIVPDIVRKAVASGIRSVFATEEGIRSLLGELLPKEIPAYLASQFESIRSELLRLVSDELRGFLEHVNLGNELQKALTALTLEIRMEVRFLPSDRGLRPSISGEIRPKRSRSDKDPQAE